MGFSIVWQGGAMAGIARDDIAFNLVENDNRAWADNASFSIGVSDLEALYQEYRDIFREGWRTRNENLGTAGVSSHRALWGLLPVLPTRSRLTKALQLTAR